MKKNTKTGPAIPMKGSHVHSVKTAKTKAINKKCK